MQISVGKHGTKIKLTKTEERKLDEAADILWAIGIHCGDTETEKYARNAHGAIRGLLEAMNRFADAESPAEVGAA